MSKIILIVEDESHIRDMIKFSLSKTEFHILEAENTLQAERIIADKIPDLILLDWMLPDKSGIEFILGLKKKQITQDIPIIMLTAKAEESNKIKGLEAGADDYVTKPFSPRELITRIRAVMRRGPLVTPDDVIQINELYVNVKTHEVRIKNNLIKLTPIEYKILYFFITHQDRVYSREQLLHHIWGGDVDIIDRTVDSQIRRLRNVLRKYNHHKLIQTIRDFGYKFGRLNENN